MCMLGMTRQTAFWLVAVVCMANVSISSAGSAEGSEGVPAHVDGTPLPQPARLVAIGDIHGDMQALKGALQLAGVRSTITNMCNYPTLE